MVVVTGRKKLSWVCATLWLKGPELATAARSGTDPSLVRSSRGMRGPLTPSGLALAWPWPGRGLVEKYEPIRRQRSYLGNEGGAALDDVWPQTLQRPSSLFFTT